MNVKKQSNCKKKKSLVQKQYLQNRTWAKERDGVTKTNQKKETHFEMPINMLTQAIMKLRNSTQNRI